VLLVVWTWIAAVAVFVIAIAASAALSSRGRAAVRRDREDEELRLGAWSDQSDEGAPAPSSTNATAAARAEQRWMAQRAHLETIKDRAMEQLRLANRHWESLAGPESDAHDIEGVLRTRDPHYVAIGAAAEVSPTMRTVNAVRDRTAARWQEAWASVGYDDPPPYTDRAGIEAELARLTTRPTAASSNAHERLAAADAWTEAGQMIDRTLVLVEPTRWLPPAELAELMGKLPAGAEVIVVLRG
jgi:hypothetical protein